MPYVVVLFLCGKKTSFDGASLALRSVFVDKKKENASHILKKHITQRILHTHTHTHTHRESSISTINKYVCHQFFFFNALRPNPSATTRVLFSMRVRWPTTRVRFSFSSTVVVVVMMITTMTTTARWLFYPRAKTLDSFYFSS